MLLGSLCFMKDVNLAALVMIRIEEVLVTIQSDMTEKVILGKIWENMADNILINDGNNTATCCYGYLAVENKQKNEKKTRYISIRYIYLYRDVSSSSSSV